MNRRAFLDVEYSDGRPQIPAARRARWRPVQHTPKVVRLLLQSPLCSLAFWLARPVDHLARCRTMLIFGYALGWRHLFGRAEVSVDGLEEEAGRNAN